MSMIIVDTREQNPIWDPKGWDAIDLALKEGDYTTSQLLGQAVIERKSGIDLYGSIIQGHNRFREELKRAQLKGITMAIFVECPKEIFVRKKFKGGFRLKAPPATLRKIVTTISDKYGVEFVWCNGREDFKEKALQWFEKEERLHAKTSTDRKE